MAILPWVWAQNPSKESTELPFFWVLRRASSTLNNFYYITFLKANSHYNYMAKHLLLLALVIFSASAAHLNSGAFATCPSGGVPAIAGIYHLTQANLVSTWTAMCPCNKAPIFNVIIILLKPPSTAHQMSPLVYFLLLRCQPFGERSIKRPFLLHQGHQLWQ